MLGILGINGMDRVETTKTSLTNRVKWVRRMSVERPTIRMIGFGLMKMIIHSNVSGETEASSM